jgi:hypothetical protein
MNGDNSVVAIVKLEYIISDADYVKLECTLKFPTYHLFPMNSLYIYLLKD